MEGEHGISRPVTYPETLQQGMVSDPEFADILVTLIERDPQDLVAYIRKFVAIKAAAFQPKPTKRKVERKTDEIPF